MTSSNELMKSQRSRKSFRVTQLFGASSNELKGKIDFHWPSNAEMDQIKRSNLPYELEAIVFKGDPGRQLQGISLYFSDNLETPFFQRQSYGNDIALPQMIEVDLDVIYNRLQVKVANQGENAMITGIRIGTINESAIDYEWRSQGFWQEPVELLPNE